MYRLFLGGTRLFEYMSLKQNEPFPINGAVRRMEDHLYRSLGLPPSSKFLDPGYSVDHVALRFARSGLRIPGIEFVAHHVGWAKEQVRIIGRKRI